MGTSKRGGLRTFRLPTLRFRGKIMLGFAVVLTISLSLDSYFTAPAPPSQTPLDAELFPPPQ